MPAWVKGQSGNPRGRPRRGFTLTEALKRHGDPDELAELLWKYAREGQAWAAVQIATRFEPVSNELTIHRSIDDFSVEELQLALTAAVVEDQEPDNAVQ